MSAGTNVGRWRIELRIGLAGDNEFNRQAFDSRVSTWGQSASSTLANKVRMTGSSTNPNTERRQNRTTMRDLVTSAIVLDSVQPVSREELADALALALQAGNVRGPTRAALATALAANRAMGTAIEAPVTEVRMTLRRLGNVGGVAASRAATAGTPGSTAGGVRLPTQSPTTEDPPVPPVALPATEVAASGPIADATNPARVGAKDQINAKEQAEQAMRGENPMVLALMIGAVVLIIAGIYFTVKE